MDANDVARILAQCEVQRLDGARRPWRIAHLPSGYHIGVPGFDPTGRGLMPYTGPVCFARKRDAEHWLANAKKNSHKYAAPPQGEA